MSDRATSEVWGFFVQRQESAPSRWEDWAGWKVGRGPYLTAADAFQAVVRIREAFSPNEERAFRVVKRIITDVEIGSHILPSRPTPREG